MTNPLENIEPNGIPEVPTVEEIKWKRVNETSVHLDGLLKAAGADLAKQQGITPVEAKIALQSMLVQQMSVDMMVGLAAEAIYRLGSREELRKALGLNG
jgi:hypothetical protein